MKLFFGLYNYLNKFVSLKTYNYIYIKIFIKMIILFTIFFLENWNKFSYEKVYYNRKIYYNKLFHRRIYFKPMMLSFNFSKINFSKFWINYVEKEKIEFFYVENYGNVSSIKYDLRTYPFWVLKIFKIDFNYLKSKIPEIKILPFLKKLEYFIWSIKIDLNISIPSWWFYKDEFFYIENFLKIPFNLISLKFQQIYFFNNLIFKSNLNLLFLILNLFKIKNNRFKFDLKNFLKLYLKFKSNLYIYVHKYINYLLLIINKFKLKYNFKKFKIKKKKILNFLKFKIFFFLIILLWFLKIFSEKIKFFFLYLIKLTWFIIISFMEPYIKINFWKNKFLYKLNIFKVKLANLFFFIKIFRKTIRKNLKWK